MVYLGNLNKIYIIFKIILRKYLNIIKYIKVYKFIILKFKILGGLL